MINIGYGIGRNYEANKENFEDNAIQLDYLCDARWEELGNRYDDIPVISPDTLLHMKDIYVIVMVVEREAKMQIVQLLENSNIPWTFLDTVLFRKRNKSMFHLVEQATVDNTLESIENALQDSESHILFDARLRMSLYGNCGELYQTLLSLPKLEATKIDKVRSNLLSTVRWLLTYQNTAVRKKVVLCKASEESYAWIKTLNLKLDAVIGKSAGGCFEKYPIIDVDTAVRQYSDAVFISGSSPDGDIRAELIARGIPRENFITRHMQLGIQYFDESLIKPSDHEIFVDAGALDLGNTLDFIRLCNGKCDKVYALEPDKLSYEKCMNKMEQMEEAIKNKIKLYNVAAWSSNTELSFVLDEQGTGGSRLCDNGKVTVKARSIDSILQGERATYIKMDIEGAELEALKGAKESIKKWRPRLAICIYHKPEDIIELPAYILSLVPDYKMYVRHYSTCIAETVLYCV